MHHQQYRAPDRPNRMPPLLAVDDPVFPQHQTRIGKHPRGHSKIMPPCFFWFDRSFPASHSKRSALYITYNTGRRGKPPFKRTRYLARTLNVPSASTLPNSIRTPDPS